MLSIYRSLQYPEKTIRQELEDVRLQDYLNDQLKRKNAKCNCCGFVSPKFQFCIDANCNPDNIKPMILCPLCYMSMRLEIAGEKSVGSVVWCPEISQVAINHYIHVVINDFINGKKDIEIQSIYSKLFNRSFELNHVVSQGSTDPAVLSSALARLSDDDYINRHKITSGMRFIPKKDALPVIFEYYSKSVYPRLST